ncbi:MAG: MarR family transcriptional regulator [Clostridia bacterium]|nr:MarR family transcriptional regulator [Clostridia bacterium]MBQ7046394.1 MarR family transcriptional regulator [Oscillospiraceae bacterium]
MKENLRDIIFQFNTLSCLHRYHISKVANSMGVYRGQPQIMDYLIKNGEATQREIADYLRVSPASVAVSVKRMAKAGLLEKTADENDLRFNKIKITPKGVEIERACRAEFDKIDKRMFSGFSHEELQQFTGFLKRINENLSGDKISREEMFDVLEEDKKRNEESL